ncbi:hypothetical protein CRG98_032920, partial [Punica granatum]
VVGILLNDNSPGVVGAAAAAFASVCPDNFSLIGKSYRRLCEILPDVEEWGQIVLIGILLRYVIAKHGLAKESVMSFLHHTETPHVGEDDPTTNFMKEETIGMMDTANSELTHMICRSYIEGPDEYLSRSSYINKGSNTLDSARYTSSKSNDDVKLLLQGTSPLLWSYNSAVVIAAAGVHWIMAPVENVLYNIQVFAKAMPSLFAPYYEDFFISSSDTYQIRSLKLDILSSIAMDSSVSAILREFQDYIRDPDRRFAADTVSAIGLCAQRLPAMAETCLDGLLALSRQEIFSSEFGSVDEESRVLTQIIMSIKSIVKHNPLRHEKVLYNAKGDDHLTVRKVVNYVFDLAECDISYDVRDRARLLKKTLEYNSGPRILETENSIPAEKDLQHAVLEHLFGGNLKPVSPEPPNSRFYLPGSLSQIVLHAAPGYEPLPKPCSLLQDDLDQISNDIRGMDLNEMNDSNTSSGSLDEETASDYSSQNSISGSSNNSDSYENGSVSEDNGNNEPLIEISEVGIAPRNENVDPQSSLAVGELMSKTALESWLDEHPGLANKDQSDSNRVRRTSARISIGDIASRVKPKVYTLLDPANGNGLKVDYSFSSEVSSISPLLVCVEVLFKNCSAEVVPEITLVDEDSNSQRDSADQLVVGSESTVPSLSELALLSNGKRIPVKLRPDIGYFVKPLHMSIEVFLDKESHLPGMFEYIRRCNFCDHLVELNKDKSQGAIEKDKFLVICESIALKMLSNANLFLVSTDMPVDSKLDDAKGLCLRFSCKILSSSVPCLISVTVEE